MSVTSTMPACRNSALHRWLDPVMWPVCDTAARCASGERPTLAATMTLPAAAARSPRSRSARGCSTPSRNSAITFVCSSVIRYSTYSRTPRSVSFPVLMT